METIEPNDVLYRRLVSFHLKPDGEITSAAFKLNGKPDPHASVDLARLTTAEDSRLSACR